MTKNTIKLLDVVALTVDLPEYNLYRGQVGTVVELLAGGAAFEVEFSDRSLKIRLHPMLNKFTPRYTPPSCCRLTLRCIQPTWKTLRE